MRFFWSQGIPYTLMLAGHPPKQLPPDQPFGGPEAPSKRKAFLASGMLSANLARYPAPIPANLWDEASPKEPRFHRVDPRSYGALLEESRDATWKRTTSSWLGLLNRTTTHRSHLAAQILFPVAFDEPSRPSTSSRAGPRARCRARCWSLGSRGRRPPATRRGRRCGRR